MPWKLPIFPEGSLAESVVTTVWIGVFVLGLINLRLGWTLSGLVIPGYMVPLIVVKPLSALVIFLEGVVTYLAVYWLVRLMTRLRVAAGFFGRDRFFALVITSIVVRLLLDGYILPRCAEWLGTSESLRLELANNLHSFGLIIVSLIANQFWKPGLLRGTVPLIVTTAVTYAVVQYVLIPFTNFSVSSFEYMYEDMASSIFASPKAYIALIVTAYIASRLNLLYSWDFNGILIPSLIAIQWYEPLKVLTSFLEAWIVYLLGKNILKLKMFKETTIEGARKLILFFNISFAYKLLIGHALRIWFPTVQASDCFGFGYLLPCLIAMKMHDKGIAVRITRTTLQASLCGAALACCIGFGLLELSASASAEIDPTAASPEAFALTPNATLLDCVKQQKVSLYQPRLEALSGPPRFEQLTLFRAGVRCVRRYLETKDPAAIQDAGPLLARAGFEAFAVERRYVVIRGKAQGGTADLFCADSDAKSALCVEVTNPRKEWATLDSGLYLFRTLGARALLVQDEGSRGGLGEGDRSRRSAFLRAFRDVLDARDSVEVRAAESLAADAWTPIDSLTPRRSELDVPAESTSWMWIPNGELADGLHLGRIESATKSLRVLWGDGPGKPGPLASDRYCARFYLAREDRRRMQALAYVQDGGRSSGIDSSDQPPAGGFEEILQALHEQLVRTEGLLPRAASAEELQYFDDEVLAPICRMAIAAKGDPEREAAELLGLSAANAAARAVGYRAALLPAGESGGKILALWEAGVEASPRCWGTYFWRLGRSLPVLVSVPKPLLEAGSLEAGALLFQDLECAQFFISGSDGSGGFKERGDVTAPRNWRSAFNLGHQVSLREASDQVFFVLQVRRLSYDARNDLGEVGAVLACDEGCNAPQQLGWPGTNLLAWLDGRHITSEFADARRETASLRISGSAQHLYKAHTRNKTFCSLWFSPYVEIPAIVRLASSGVLARLRYLGLNIHVQSLAEVFDSQGAAECCAEPPDDWKSLLCVYKATGDITSLDAALKIRPDFVLEAILDPTTDMAFLLAFRNGALVPLIVNLTTLQMGGSGCEPVQLDRRPDEAEVLKQARRGVGLILWQECHE